MRRRRFRYGLRIFLVIFLLAGVAAGAGWALTHLELFALKKIEVLGNPQTLKSTQIIQKTGVKTGSNLFAIDLDQIHKTLKKHDFFKEIYVHRRLPSTLVIEVKEFDPQFVLYTGRFYYIDREGEIFKDITDTADKRDFPVLTGIGEEEVLNLPHWVKKVLTRAGDLKEAYQNTEFAKAFGLSEIHYEKNIGFILYPEKKKYSIKFGRKDFGEKIEKLTQVMEKLSKKKAPISSIDLNYPGKILMTL